GLTLALVSKPANASSDPAGSSLSAALNSELQVEAMLAADTADYGALSWSRTSYTYDACGSSVAVVVVDPTFGETLLSSLCSPTDGWYVYGPTGAVGPTGAIGTTGAVGPTGCDTVTTATRTVAPTGGEGPTGD